MKFVRIVALTTFLAFLFACSNYERLYSESQNGKSGTEITASGVFDLKVICMNAGLNNVVNDDHCEGYFSESSGPNARTVEVDLMICTKSLVKNCIERLPEDAPPEVIVIRDNAGNKTGTWSSTKVKFQTKGSGKKTRFHAVEIF